MEYYLKYPPREYQLIKVLFYILFGIVALMIVLLFTLKINETATIINGEIIAKTPPSSFIVPFESEVETLYVQPGQKVLLGDTMLVLQNNNLDQDLARTKQELINEEQKLANLKIRLTQLTKGISVQRSKEKLLLNKQRISEKNVDLRLDNLKEQLVNRKRALEISEERFKKDQQLFEKELLSGNQFKEREQQYLKAKEIYNATYNLLEREVNNEKNLGQNYLNQMSDFQLVLLKSESQKAELTAQIGATKIQIEQLKNQLNYTEKEAVKTFIIADKDGYVANLYNQFTNTNFLAKGTTILDLFPDENQAFYAKLMVSQANIRDVTEGQTTHLKVDAYNYLQYGIIKGEVIFINKAADGNFFVLTDLTPPQEGGIQLKNGFKVKGNIVLKKVKLYKFFFNKLFKTNK